MPFEVFRRHQRKLLTIFAILAMSAFVLSDSVPRLLSSNAAGRDQKVVELQGVSVYQSQLNELARQRNRANLFVSAMVPYLRREVFGGLKQRDLVDALILQREADRLGMPATPDMAREWLSQFAQNFRIKMGNDLFNALYSRFSNEVSEEHLLSDIANQVRIRKVRELLGMPIVTPYDVFRSYREQNERVGGKLVEVPVDSFLAKVGEPSGAELQALYDQYKDVLPDPARETPGFKIPREVQLEILSLDGKAVSQGIRNKLTETELRSYYENHKTEFEVPSELPADLFADQPDLTPPVIQTFADVRGLLAPRLAEERAQAEIQDRFDRIKEEVMIPFAEKYLGALDDQEEAKKQAGAANVPLPVAESLKPVADREGLNYEKTEMLSKEAGERHGQVSTSEVGMTPMSGGRRFVDEVFDPKTGLYEPVELTDILGTRYLVRKLKDEPPHIPPLNQVREVVTRAWKLAKARPLAEKAADDLAKQLNGKGATIKDPKVEGFQVVTIPPITRSQTSFMQTSPMDPDLIETPIPDVPFAGDVFRNAYFELRPGTAVVAPNQPRTSYYVMTLDRQEPARFSALYAPNGDEYRYNRMAATQALKIQDEQWMNLLRQRAGLKPDWVPPDEIKKDEMARR